jgi:hypothetical protein
VDGLIERRIEQVWVAVVQLVGRDGTDRIVSFSQPVRVRWDSPWDAERFAVGLHPKGGEQRYDVRVESFQYKVGVGSSH